MKITNKTSWQSDHLRAIVRRIAAVELTPAQRKVTTVVFLPDRRDAHWAGRAHLRQMLAEIRIHTKGELSDAQRINLASTIAHELFHLKTKASGRIEELWMRKSVKYGYPQTEEKQAEQREYYGWILQQPLERKTRPRIHTDAKVRSEIVHLESLVKAWETKLKRAENAIKKYRKQITNQQRKLVTLVAKSVNEAEPGLIADVALSPTVNG